VELSLVARTAGARGLRRRGRGAAAAPLALALRRPRRGRYLIVMTLVLLLYGVPIKMLLRLLLGVKYVLATPCSTCDARGDIP